MKQKWIRLFQHNERCNLEENLNLFLKDHPDTEIIVWTDQGLWHAQAIYSYKDSPTYFHPED